MLKFANIADGIKMKIFFILCAGVECFGGGGSTFVRIFLSWSTHFKRNEEAIYHVLSETTIVLVRTEIIVLVRTAK